MNDDQRTGENINAGDDGIADTTANSGGASYDPGVIVPVQDTLHASYANADPNHNCYLDFVVIAGNDAMTFRATVAEADLSPYLSTELHAGGTANAHSDMHYTLDGMGFGRPSIGGDSQHDPHSVVFLRMILAGQLPGTDLISNSNAHELGHSVFPEAHNFHTSGHSAAPDNRCTGDPTAEGEIRWCPAHARRLRNNVTRKWDPHSVAVVNPAETDRDSD